ncbi:FUSC family protein [Hansschlegelia quercus]|uniref:FUSC family protein n=2 Tax=Hansschlegelia quercus TaxID=2528245 RepID=A0A4Q9GIF4_9HYPH|nr:FUSC family protein [Hansschlegelia quercus]TBN54009.1 FUSC family protein [Hansschlegelia quercus]
MFTQLADRHAADVKFAVKVAVASVSAFVLATLLGLPQGYWSVISALIVVQASVGGTVTAAQERAVGTVIGSLVGGAAAFFHPHSLISTSITLTVVVAVLAFAAAGRPMLRLAPITAAILLVATANQTNTLEIAAERIMEVLLGCAIGVVATLVVFPAHVDRDLAKEARAVAHDIAALLRGAPTRKRGPDGAHLLLGAQDAIRRKLAALEKTVTDARRAPGARSGAEARSSLARTLWRVRNDAVAVERALAAAPDATRRMVGPLADEVILAAADMLDEIAAGHDAAIARAETDAKLAALDDAVAHLRDGETVRLIDVAAAVPTMGLVFALRNLDANLGDLADRLGEAQERAQDSAD